MWIWLLAALLPLAVFSVVMLAVFETQQSKSLDALMREAAVSASNAVDNEVNATVAVLSALAASSEFQAQDWSAFADHAEPMVRSTGWLTLVVTDGEKQILNLRGLSAVADRVGIAEALRTGKPAVSNLVPVGPNNAEPAVVIRIPVPRADGPPRLTLAAFIPASAFTRLLHEHVPENWISALADREGTILARSHRAETFVGTPLSPDFFVAWREGRYRVFDARTKDGVLSYGRLTRAGAAGWVLAIAAPKELVDGRYRLARHALWVGGAIAALLTVLLTATVLRMVERGREADRLRLAAAAERAINETRRRLDMALECANAAMWEWEVETNRALWSDEFYSLYGVPTEVPPSYEAWLAQVYPEDRARMAAYVAEARAKRVTEVRLEFRIVHPLRGLRWILSQGRAVSGLEGAPLRISGVSIDITDRKEMEAEVQRALGEAERANLAKSRFLAAASHDIRQPIQSLMLFAHALDAKLANHPARPVVTQVLAALGALKLLLDSILDISKLDAGLVHPDRSSFPAGDFLARLAAEYQPRMAAKGLRFKVVGASAWIESDPTLLGRIVGNLLENALKYTNRGGVLLGCRHRDGRLAITVADTGVGISPEHQHMVFEEFVQVGSQGRDRAQGMGLGLATVKRMGALLGHRVGLKSVPGRGSTFWVEVPLAEPQGPGAHAPAPAHASEACSPVPARVLVVDDETAILDGMRVILEACGHLVAVAGSAEEAEARVAGGFEPDVVVTDYRLPQGRNGAEVIRRIRDACRRTVPCVVLTGDTEIVAASLPATTVMHKPVNPHDLVRIIGRLWRAA